MIFEVFKDFRPDKESIFIRGNSAPRSAPTFDQLEELSLRLSQNLTQNSRDFQSIDMVGSYKSDNSAYF